MCISAHSARKRIGTIALFVLAAGMPALAETAETNSYSAALKARNYREAERSADAALAADPNDPQALFAKVEVIVAVAPQSRIDEAVGLAEKCIAAHPRESGCFESLGNALGTKALNAEAFSAMGYARKIRDAYHRAVELDPRNMSARYSLLQYYLAAPAIVGGGKDKARALAAETARLDPNEGQVMQAMIDLAARDPAKAEREIGALNGTAGDSLAEQRRDVLWSIGKNYLAAKRFADAERVFRQLQSAYPGSELGVFGLARSLQEQGKHDRALPLFEKALKIYPRAVIYYRMAQSLQASGSKARALNVYEKALSMEPGLDRKQMLDAQNQIKGLQ